MKALRKSLNGDRTKESIRSHISTPLPAISKPSSAILPPQKVIRATQDHRPQAPQELSFHKGDFFHVVRDVDDGGAWYEAHNPVTGARGLVPRALFEELGRNAFPARMSTSGTRASIDSMSPSSVQKRSAFYAVVLHDFEAERADELSARRDDPITIVAQSNREWFVAKPIGRIGRPGLIPVSFVRLEDPSTGKTIEDVDGLIDRGEIPRVEDWKRSVLDYKQNSIALGVIDTPKQGAPLNSFSSKNNSRVPSPDPSRTYSPTQTYVNDDNATVAENSEGLPEGLLVAADVVSFHYEMEEYWFRIDAVFQPYAKLGRPLPPAKQLILFRVYNDFYDFQVALLDTFPREAGRQPPEPRLLPYMPGPVPPEQVDDQLTAARRVELDGYIHSLCELGRSGNKYVLEHPVVRDFLSLKPGDVENHVTARVQDIQAAFASRRDSRGVNGHGQNEYGQDVRASFGRLSVNDSDHRSDGSEYEDEGYAPSPERTTHDHNHYPYNNKAAQRQSNDGHLYAQKQHQRTDSTTSFRAHSPYASTSRSNSPLYPDRNSAHPPHTPEPRPYHHASTPSTSSFRSRSHSTAANTNPNSPSISATNPQPAFVKIKIFNRGADDLIAIRVHPRVTHAELMDKVQARMGNGIENVSYRDSMTGSFVELDSDEELRGWMESTDKHVLYAV